MNDLIKKFVSSDNAKRFLTSIKLYIDGKINSLSNNINNVDDRLKKIEENGVLTKEQAEKIINLLNTLYDSDSDI